MQLEGLKANEINVRGVDVLLVKVEIGKESFWNSYAELKGSSIVNDNFLGNPTFRKGDVVGFDTGHAWNMLHTIDEKLLDAIFQIDWAIESWKNVIRGD